MGSFLIVVGLAISIWTVWSCGHLEMCLLGSNDCACRLKWPQEQNVFYTIYVFHCIWQWIMIVSNDWTLVMVVVDVTPVSKNKASKKNMVNLRFMMHLISKNVIFSIIFRQEWGSGWGAGRALDGSYDTRRPALVEAIKDSRICLLSQITSASLGEEEEVWATSEQRTNVTGQESDVCSWLVLPWSMVPC